MGQEHTRKFTFCETCKHWKRHNELIGMCNADKRRGPTLSKSSCPLWEPKKR